MVISIEVSNSTMMDRLIKRSLTSGRVDDNVETIKKRLETFHTQTKPVIDYYEQQHKAKRINAESSPEIVFDRIKKVMNDAITGKKTKIKFKILLQCCS